jgi:preprotein translocase subunit SecE
MAVGDTIQNTRTFVEESYAELQKVTWPDQEQLKNATLVVIAFTIAISLIIWLMDSVVRLVVNQIMGIFGA